MAKDSEQPVGVPAVLSFDVKYMQQGRHSVMLLLPDAYHALIGRVVAYWGNFEVVFDACLAGLIAGEVESGSGRDTSGWRHRSFPERRRLFKRICEEWLSATRSEAAERLKALVDSSATLHSKRNLIAHGTYGYTIPPQSAVATACYAINPATGEKLAFDEDVLKRLYHDISHLTADLVLAFKDFADVEGAFYAIPDAEISRIYTDTVHPWNPDPSKRP